MTVHIIAEDTYRWSSIAALLQPAYSPSFAKLDRPNLRFLKTDAVIVAVDLRSIENIERLRLIEVNLRCAKKRIFIVDSISHLHAAQACALGATKVLFQPDAHDLARELADKMNSTVGFPDNCSEAAAMGAAAIKVLFASVSDGDPIDITAMKAAGAMIVDAIAEEGLSHWLDVVRDHHEGTYQHCLLVTGVTVDFGLHLGLNRRDIARLHSAAMLHDVGKAAIPISILDKPGKLDDNERTTIETHPAIGYDVLKNVAGVTPEILDSVRHHHEFLDGSGYPDRLSGSSIGDLVRILTISDIFAALIERRSYRPPMARETAYDIIRDMRGKLEMPLVTAFKDVALVR